MYCIVKYSDQISTLFFKTFLSFLSRCLLLQQKAVGKPLIDRKTILFEAPRPCCDGKKSLEIVFVTPSNNLCYFLLTNCSQRRIAAPIAVETFSSRAKDRTEGPSFSGKVKTLKEGQTKKEAEDEQDSQLQFAKTFLVVLLSKIVLWLLSELFRSSETSKILSRAAAAVNQGKLWLSLDIV